MAPYTRSSAELDAIMGVEFIFAPWRKILVCKMALFAGIVYISDSPLVPTFT